MYILHTSGWYRPDLRAGMASTAQYLLHLHQSLLLSLALSACGKQAGFRLRPVHKSSAPIHAIGLNQYNPFVVCVSSLQQT
ncbi:hypothetical protein D3C76_1269530 [compost metagenome]